MKKNSFEHFNVIDTEEKAYWLGFIYADGSVDKRHKRLKVTLSQRDEEHLVKLRDFLGLKTSFYIYAAKNFSKAALYMCHPQVELTVYSVELFNALCKYGVVPNKTYVGQLDLSNVPENLHVHVWRGMIDGDGSVTSTTKSRSLQLTGSENTCVQFLNFIKKHINTNVTVTSDKSVKCVRFSKTMAANVAQLIYLNSTVYMTRKKSKALQITGSENPVFKTPVCVQVKNEVKCFESLTSFAKNYSLTYKNVYYSFKKSQTYKDFKFVSAT